MIELSNGAFSSYECVKCMLSPSGTTAYVLDKRAYAEGNSKRHKTLEQYMGCKLELNGLTFGFLNIEFHNRSIFIDEAEMQDFMEQNVFPFKLLLEYQYLKRRFFGRLDELGAQQEAISP